MVERAADAISSQGLKKEKTRMRESKRITAL